MNSPNVFSCSAAVFSQLQCDAGLLVREVARDTEGGIVIVSVTAREKPAAEVATRWLMFGFPAFATAVLLQLLQIGEESIDGWLRAAIWIAAVVLPAGIGSAFVETSFPRRKSALVGLLRLVGNVGAASMAICVVAHFEVVAACVGLACAAASMAIVSHTRVRSSTGPS